MSVFAVEKSADAEEENKTANEGDVYVAADYAKEILMDAFVNKSANANLLELLGWEEYVIANDPETEA